MAGGNIEFVYDFRPVGQGLFSVGEVKELDSDHSFRWVYDCGTLSGIKIVEDQIKLCKSIYGQNINVLFLSHFDTDHINGVCQLLSCFQINTVVLPYTALWERLVVAFLSDIHVDDDLIDFFIDPGAYLIRQADGKIISIAYIERFGDSIESDMSEIRMRASDIVFGDDDGRDSLLGKITGEYILRSGLKFMYGNVWELIPYNFARKNNNAWSAFIKAVEQYKNVLLNGSSKKINILNQLKILYDSQFGRTSIARNFISTFLYSGMIEDRYAIVTTDCYDDMAYSILSNQITKKTGCIYSGDGFLNTNRRISTYADFLGPERINNIFCFQVPHHGSKRSHHHSLPTVLHPAASIFSSDPGNKKYKHPNRCVLQDYLGFGPIQVDKANGFEVRGSTFSPVQNVASILTEHVSMCEKRLLFSI